MKAGDIIWGAYHEVFDRPFLIVEVHEHDVKVLNLTDGDVLDLHLGALNDMLTDGLIRLEES